jgi:putative two-component system response regulator
MRTREPKTRVLAVDDDADFLKAIRMMLEPRYRVECLSSGLGLLDQIEALRPDAVILDVHMPDVDGFKLCRSIRSDRRMAGLPVLFLTASREDEDFLKNLDVGADAFVNKPVSQRTLQARLREIMLARCDVGPWMGMD